MNALRRWRRHPLREAVRLAIWIGFWAAVAVLRLLGARPARILGRGLGRLAGLLPYERRIATRQLAQAFGECDTAWVRATRRACFAHLGESAVELLYVERALAGTTCDGWDVLQTALAAERGAVVVSGHVGNWELIAPYLARHGYAITVIARRIYDPRFDIWMRAWRARFGIETIVRDNPGAVKAMLRALRERRLLGILIDQHTNVESVAVDFFARPAATPVAAARLAERGIPVLVATARRTAPWRHHITITAPSLPADRVAATQVLSQQLEARIREAPEQWPWFHRRWRLQSDAGV